MIIDNNVFWSRILSTMYNATNNRQAYSCRYALNQLKILY